MARTSTLSLREPGAPGDVSWEPTRLPSPSRQRRVVLLVHGFNTGVTDANAAYDGFIANVRSMARGRRLPADLGFVRVHWPGDHPGRMISKATYSVRVPIATMTGDALAVVVSRMQATEVSVVAHSLGSRVALRFLAARRLHGRGSSRKVAFALLMAAAVPVDACEAPGEFGVRRATAEREVALYSSRDRVLKRFFPVGEYLVGHRGARAVGLTGEPANRWESGTSRDLGLDHGDYWASSESAAALVDLLKVGETRSLARRIPHRRDAAGIGRQLPFSVLPKRKPPQRRASLE
ncbi:alpha/beta hydrolase [Microbacterium sp. NPDC055455]